MNETAEIREAISRLSRLDNSAAWQNGLNPTQRAALEYLARANRFSRSPSHLADYLGATRGTVSQTLKSLVQKRMVSEKRSETDKRAVSFTLTQKGADLAAAVRSDLGVAVDALPGAEKSALADGLRRALAGVIGARGGRVFGICRTCRYHDSTADGGFCKLLNLGLSAPESDMICHEHQPAPNAAA